MRGKASGASGFTDKETGVDPWKLRRESALGRGFLPTQGTQHAGPVICSVCSPESGALCGIQACVPGSRLKAHCPQVVGAPAGDKLAVVPDLLRELGVGVLLRRVWPGATVHSIISPMSL